MKRPLDDAERQAMERVRADAVELGIPFVGDTYLIDTPRWHESDHYKTWRQWYRDA